MSITLSMPPALVKEVKVYASAHGTTLSQLTRDLYASARATPELVFGKIVHRHWA